MPMSVSKAGAPHETMRFLCFVLSADTPSPTYNRAQRPASASALEKWKADPYGVFILDDMAAAPRFGWFDRSLGEVVRFGAGNFWDNPALARFHGRPTLTGLPAKSRDALWNCSVAGRPLVNVPGWCELPGIDLLFSYSANDAGDAPKPVCGDRLTLNVEYDDPPPRLGVLARLANRITRKGWAPFSCKAPDDEMNLIWRCSSMDSSWTPRKACAKSRCTTAAFRAEKYGP